MTHRLIARLSALCCVLMAGCAEVRAEQIDPRTSPVCVYNSKSYSSVAFICVQKALMISCSSDGGQMVWKVVSDQDLSNRCIAPTIASTSPESPERRSHRIVHHRRV